jgi:hypothetical protein
MTRESGGSVQAVKAAETTATMVAVVRSDGIRCIRMGAAPAGDGADGLGVDNDVGL